MLRMKTVRRFCCLIIVTYNRQSGMVQKANIPEFLVLATFTATWQSAGQNQWRLLKMDEVISKGYPECCFLRIIVCFSVILNEVKNPVFCRARAIID